MRMRMKMKSFNQSKKVTNTRSSKSYDCRNELKVV